MAYRVKENLATLIQDQRKTLLLNRGNPARYRLLTHREYLDGKVWKPQNESMQLSDANIRRWRFGEVNPQSINKTILIVGETGTGKTTLINAMVNHMLGVKLEDKVWFEITEEEKRNQAETQTTAVTVYQVYMHDNPNSLTIIDTPGYRDTRGVEHDKDIPELLRTLFSSYQGVYELDSVGLVVKASQNRLTDTQKYIFDTVLSIFGKDLEKSIVICITHSDGMPPDDALNAIKEAETPCAKEEDGDPVYFMMNNRQCQQYKEKHKSLYKTAWETSHDSINDLFKFLNKTSGKNLRMTEDVLTKRKQLESCVINLQQRIAIEENTQSELKQIEEALKANKDKLDKNENFEFEVEEIHKAEVSIADVFKMCKELATRCTKCKENCHFPGCTLATKQQLWTCDVMKKDSNGDYVCQVCTGGCSYTHHVKDGNIYQGVTKTVRKTAYDLRKEFEDKYGTNVDLKARTEQKLEDSKKEESRLVVEAYETIMQLQEIALKKEAMSIVVHLDFLIKKLKESGHPEKAEELEEIQKRAPPVSTGIKAFYKTLQDLTLHGIPKWWK